MLDALILRAMQGSSYFDGGSPRGRALVSPCIVWSLGHEVPWFVVLTLLKEESHRYELPPASGARLELR